MISDHLPPDWDFLRDEIDEIQKIIGKEFIPTERFVLRALQEPISKARVVIIGQDPYPKPENAIGLAFCVPKLIKKLPPTLQNILTELSSDLGIPKPAHGDLSSWTQQGVILLNLVLTTKPGESLGHENVGWQNVTKRIVEKYRDNGCVFILWGKQAQSLEKMIPSEQRISGVHPSPLSAYRGFFGSKPFSTANSMLLKRGLLPIDWKI